MESADDIKLSIIPNISNEFLKEVERKYNEGGILTDESLIMLHSIYGSSMERALELLDSNNVTHLQVQEVNRRLIQVSGSSGMIYTLFPRVNYCPCPAYRHHVLGTRTKITCKHILVARLSEIMGKSRDVLVTSEEMSNFLCTAADIRKI